MSGWQPGGEMITNLAYKALTAEEQEDPSYLTTQLITYIGNNRSLLGHISEAVLAVRDRLGGK